MGGDHINKHGDNHHGRSPLHEFEEATKCFVDFLVLFAFGVVNAGVQVSAIGGLTFVVLLALVVGKTGGITLASAVATMFGCPPPPGLELSSIAAIGFIASAGLTVALFVSGEAFEQHPVLSAQAKMGALLSIIVALIAIVGSRVWQALTNKGVVCVEEFPVGLDRCDDDDEAFEDVVVSSTVNKLQSIQQTEQEIEHLAHFTRIRALTRLRQAHAPLQKCGDTTNRSLNSQSMDLTSCDSLTA